MSNNPLQTILYFTFFVIGVLYPAFAHDFSIIGYSPTDLSSEEKLHDLFVSWISKHARIYNSLEEKLLRFKIFKDNLKHIDERNKHISGYWLGLNEFADLTHQEFKNKYMGLGVVERRKSDSAQDFTYKDVTSIPNPLIGGKKVLLHQLKTRVLVVS